MACPEKNHIITIITSWLIRANCLSQFCRNKKPMEIQWKIKTVPIFDKAWILDLNLSKIVWFEPYTPPCPLRKLILLALQHRELGKNNNDLAVQGFRREHTLQIVRVWSTIRDFWICAFYSRWPNVTINLLFFVNKLKLGLYLNN